MLATSYEVDLVGTSRCDVHGRRSAASLPIAFRTKAPLLQLNQPTPCRVSDGFGPADDIHLSEDAFHVRLHCALTNKEGGADLLVAFSLSHQFEHFNLTPAQRFAADALREFGREVHRHAGLAGVHPANAIH